METEEFIGQDFVGVAARARIRTPGGSRPVEELAPGELVLTGTGTGIAKPILWIGRKQIEPLRCDPRHGRPVRVCAGALGQGPAHDLLLSPWCALLVGGVLVEASALVNGTTVRREEIGAFCFFGLEFADQELVLADGIAVESFVAPPGCGTPDDDGFEEGLPGDSLFDNWPERLMLRPEWETGAELPLPRARSARQVPRAVRALLGQATLHAGGAPGSGVAG